MTSFSPLTPTLRAERVKDGALARAAPMDCSPKGEREFCSC